ncbi:hypothetical protein LAJ19_00405 [Deinococcus taeanensis]|uniref:hypothetical protein n=1 Tax=Deinococcus taeanensis TaxID=2737050 RepID=UPI001CDD2EB6|nr:hypothetical protein [Deinococcus taeanensis]UBV42735.1 hypothetical protein LAJ19_00405 [Deinococcus taeanensis]
MEFLVQTADGELYDLKAGDLGKAFRPKRLPFHKVEGQGMVRLNVSGSVVEINDEMGGLQIYFEDEGDHATASRIVDSLVESLIEFTGIQAKNH